MAFQVLLVEDNPADAALLQLMLEEHAPAHTLHRVENGAAALNFLYRRGVYTAAPRPDLILLDLNLPLLSGYTVLEWVKQDPELAPIPVVVFTSSKSADDIYRCYKSYANSYVQKPLELADYEGVIRSLHQFWFQTAQLPLAK